MTLRARERLISIIVLGLLAVIGVALVLRATPEGLALSDDSIGYVAGARSMVAGNGYREAWLASNGPVTHFPPAYSSVLALIGLFGLDPLRGARFLGAVLFGLNTIVLGILAWRMTKFLRAGLILAALFVLNDSLLRLHAAALSEPLFIFLSLLALWMLDLYFERDAHWLWLVASGAFAGMAYLTRYAALALVGTIALALVLARSTWRKRMTSGGIFFAGFLPWMAGWALRNKWVGGTATNRVLVWHPITATDLQTALRTSSMFLLPVEPWREALLKVKGVFPIVILLVLAAILLWIAVTISQRLGQPRSQSAPVILTLASALYVYGYLFSIFAAMFLFDASTKFKLRILSPIYVSILILVVALGKWAWSQRREFAAVAALVLFGLSSYGQVAAVAELSRGGQGYASFKWYDSKAMAFLRGLPQDAKIYTNEPGAVYLYAGRPAYVLPDRIDPVTAEARPGFETGVEQMQAEIDKGEAVLALFSGGDSTAADAERLSRGLHLAHKSAGAEIFATGP
jgi:4-amino-4-deoxy-L-arabinose transferase-like glycosyltransferase